MLNCARLNHAHTRKHYPHIHTHTCTHAYTYTYILTYIHAPIHMHPRIHTLPHSHIRTHIYTYLYRPSHIHKQTHMHSLAYTKGLSVFIPGDMPNPSVFPYRHGHVHIQGNTHMLCSHICWEPIVRLLSEHPPRRIPALHSLHIHSFWATNLHGMCSCEES